MLKSLSAKLNVTLVCVTTLMLGAAGAWNTQHLRTLETERLEQDASTILKRLDATLPQALWDFSAEQAVKVIRGELHHPSLLAIRVLDVEGKEFTQGLSEANGVTTLPSHAIERSVPLNYQDGGTSNKVGSVTLYMTDAPIQARLKDAVITRFIEIIVLDILLSLALAFSLGKLIMSPLQRVLDNLNSIARERDLGRRIEHHSTDELGQLAGGINAFLNDINTVVTEINHATGKLMSVAHQASESQDKLQEEMTRQQFAIDMLTTALHEIGISARNVAHNSNDTAKLVSTAQRETATGLKQVEMATDTTTNLTKEVGRSAEAIDQLRQKVDTISVVLDVIRDVAEQTNLLALNASIEAARAGDQGRGFAVVADEVRSLASRTQQSTRQISMSLEDLHHSTEKTVVTMRESLPMATISIENARDAGQSINRILESVNKILEQAQQIASAAEQQSASLNEIDQSVSNINNVLDHTLEVAETTRRLNHDLVATVSNLQKLTVRFKTL
jgi:methyl-accepting chemotaxis protein